MVAETRRSLGWAGYFFNLIIASWIVADTIGITLMVLGVPPWLTLPLWLYAVWIGGNAISGAMPTVNMQYILGGILIGMIPATLAMAVAMGFMGIARVIMF